MSCVHFFGIICTMITFLEFFHIVHAVFVYVFILKILNLLSLVIVCLTIKFDFFVTSFKDIEW